MPGNIAPADDVAPSELPDGFTLAGPGGGGGGGGGGGSNDNSSSADHRAAAQHQRDAHRQAILEQAMTPEALARLRRVKVGIIICVARRIYIYIGGRERERERERELLPCFLLDLDVFKQQLRILHRPNSPLVGMGNGNAIAAPHIFRRFLFTSNLSELAGKKGVILLLRISSPDVSDESHIRRAAAVSSISTNLLLLAYYTHTTHIYL